MSNPKARRFVVTPSTAGLCLFVAVVALTVVGLCLDWCLLRAGLPTISETARTYPPLGYLILIVWLFGGLGLADHFTLRGDPPPGPVAARAAPAEPAGPGVPGEAIAGRIADYRPRPALRLVADDKKRS